MKPNPPSSAQYFSDLQVGSRTYRYLDLKRLLPEPALAALPRSTKILCENVLRNSSSAADTLKAWAANRALRTDVPFYPSRVLMHDTTCSPALADMAGMRDAVAERGGNPEHINPAIQTDLVIDHSVAVDEYGHRNAAANNLARDFTRNAERYRFIKWAQQSLRNFRVVPPGSGILHQVNLEYLAEVVRVGDHDSGTLLYPDTLLGTDSHTPMINALGILAWGVGGIEAQAAILGEPVSVVLPRVVGVHLHGDLGPGVTATDLVLHLTRTFREHGVVDKIVEFYGPSVKNLTVGDRATASNMAPEYGATCSYFPIDQQTLKYLADTGRSSEQVARVKAYAQAQSLWADDGATDPVFDELLDINLSRIVPTMSGPRQPHEEQALPDVWNSFCKEYSPVTRTDTPYQDGLIALAAITSCTNTSNPALLIGAGLLARNARKRGLTRKPWVKTSLSPGSKAVSAYLAQAGLQDDLDALGFNVVGYGCMTCIGNSGSLEPDVIEAVEKHGLRAVGVISGNRNFDGRVNPHLAGAYLASPALAVAAAIAGTVRLDFSKDAIGTDKSGNPVTLADLWPPDDEIRSTLTRSLAVGHFTGSYENVWQGSDAWRAMTVAGSAQFAWDPESNYIRRPPYVEPVAADDTAPLQGLRPLLMLADNVTTDHISPAGPVPGNSVAGRYLTSRGVEPADFNVYAARRTNHEVMMRGAFSNPKLINELAAGNNAPLPCYAWNVTHDRLLPAYEAAQSYGNNQKFIILAGRNYGAGSSRDWAAKAPVLLGVRAIVAESYERIHRSNLIGMGIYPLEFSKGTSRRDLCSDGTETIDIEIGELRVGQTALNARIRAADGALRQVTVICRIDSATELIYLKQRGVLRHIVLKTLGTSVN